MRNYVKLVKSKGNSYCVYDRDIYIVFYLVGYKIKNNMIRIPYKYLNKVKILLDKNNINYKIIKNDKIIEEKKYTKSNYNKYINIGIDYYNKYLEKENLIDIINNMDKDDFIKVSEYINYVIYK